MNNKKIRDKLGAYIDTGFPIVFMNTFEEMEADRIISSVVDNENKIMEWNNSEGMVSFKYKNNPFSTVKTLEETLEYVKYDEDVEILVLKDAVEYLRDNKIVALLKDLANRIRKSRCLTIIIVSQTLEIPTALDKCIEILEMDYMSEEEIQALILEVAQVNGVTDFKKEVVEKMAVSFKGLSKFEVENILSLTIENENTLKDSDLKFVTERKQQIVKKSNILEMIETDENIDDIGGLDNLKEWLNSKAKVFSHIDEAKKFGVDVPKGVLIVGVTGCGKSLSAKAASNLFNVPLLRLDMGRIMGKYVGESEQNMRKAISLAEAISPCILWIDELEKAFAGIGQSSGNGEITTRLFGNFLTWMQEKKSMVFVVATSNDISKLPPEFVRKGRFDEIFYIELPNIDERKKIFEIHIRKRRERDIKNIKLDELSEKTENFNGAEIEGVIKEGIENAFTNGKQNLSTEDFLRVINDTKPLAKIIEKLNEKNNVKDDNAEISKLLYKKASKGR